MPACSLLPMNASQLDAVMAIETAAYTFPWSRGNFIDSIAAGYAAQVLVDAQGELLGYFVAMGGVDEMHLLNITVAPAAQGRGHARFMIAALVALCRAEAARELWLEVRAGKRLRLAASAGASVFPHDGATYEALLADADHRMYRDKALRRGHLGPSRPAAPAEFITADVIDHPAKSRTSATLALPNTAA